MFAATHLTTHLDDFFAYRVDFGFEGELFT